MIKYETIDFLGGHLTAFERDGHLVFISLANDGVAEFLSEYQGYELEPDTLPVAQLFHQYENGLSVDWTRVPIDFLSGTEFQKSVWRTLNQFKGTLTYSQLAEKVGRPKAIRAVASAVGKNPLPIINACHRILPKSGGVGKFRYGTLVKTQLLTLEGIKID
ncbi:methylated-DNA--[protein]-cysteine S-methyltransferase [Leuconostoc pseudomesenteroides]|uniref:MGMT family protein n=1 Tax=Leuconostoc pseudomesenteroides TaxID=33968 RepID=A0A5B8T4H6_LEUPS|nr:MGMT family protein [Leuconostoc pseudomesenteroides]MCC8440350.1 cysteine methyltransferase [Leuconostoc pseudomesenteroides]MDG9733299.1 MGMT family protein [Leuconostoc pseudomesenteroides]NKZ36552.1 MGMT family protein [Leuconostoc pseudomesenteroides]QEA42775.1 MGMT family protein [Leuconostoc pseudomesenteroides]QQB26894.1 MGMT family protein [Leuconostoc pseudomesenteroides]